MNPIFGKSGIGRCSHDECPEYDGKRCRLMGFFPDGICEPWVAQLLETLGGRNLKYGSCWGNPLSDPHERMSIHDLDRACKTIIESTTKKLRELVENYGNACRTSGYYSRDHEKKP